MLPGRGHLSPPRRRGQFFRFGAPELTRAEARGCCDVPRPQAPAPSAPVPVYALAVAPRRKSMRRFVAAALMLARRPNRSFVLGNQTPGTRALAAHFRGQKPLRSLDVASPSAAPVSRAPCRVETASHPDQLLQQASLISTPPQCTLLHPGPRCVETAVMLTVFRPAPRRKLSSTGAATAQLATRDGSAPGTNYEAATKHRIASPPGRRLLDWAAVQTPSSGAADGRARTSADGILGLGPSCADD